MQKIKNNLLVITTICIILGVTLFQVLAYYLFDNGMIGSIDYIKSEWILYISVIILGIIYLYDLAFVKQKFDKYDYIFVALVLAATLSVIFSINKNIAIFGKTHRHEGYLSIISYYLLFINWKNNGNIKNYKIIYKVILGLGLANVIYSILQVYTDFDFILRVSVGSDTAKGLCGNQNFLGTLMVTLLSMVTTKYLLNKEKNKFDFVLIILFFITLINAQSTGPFLAYIIYFIFMTIYLKIKNKINIKRTFILLGTLIITFLFIINFNNLYLKKMFNKKNINEYSLKSVNRIIDSGGSGRLDILKNSIPIVKEHFVFGIGFDNLYLIYPHPKKTVMVETKKGKEETIMMTIIDNTHNVYLHTLVSEGIIGLIPYLLLCLFVFIKGLKSKNNIIIILLGGFVGYSVQAFVNLNVIHIAPIYYIIMGLILSNIDRETQY